MGVNTGEGAKGALGGAATGAALGSVVPGIGTGIGAVGGAIIGGLGGLFGGGGGPSRAEQFTEEEARLGNAEDLRRRARVALGRIAARRAPQARAQGPFRDAQLGLLGTLQGQATGRELSAGELAVARQTGRAIAQQQAGAAAARGQNAALAARAAGRNIADIGTTAAGQAAEARIRGQQAAAGLAGQIAGQGRGQDQEIQLANMDALLKQRGLDDNARINLLSQLFNIDKAELDARIKRQAIVLGEGGGGGGFGDSLLQVGGTALAGLASRG